MRSTASTWPLTIDEYARIPDDGRRTELVCGELLREPQPGFRHGRLQATLLELLGSHVRGHAPHLVCLGNVGVITEEDPGTVRGPDVAVVRRTRADDLHRSGFLRGAPDLAIEIVSPSNRAAEVQAKVREYLLAGASLVWVVYPDTRTVAVHASPTEARFVGEDEVLTGGELLPGLRLAVAELFAG